MTDENKKIVEINGVNLEVDLRTAKKVESYKIGDSIRVLIQSYNGYDVHYGVIVDFAEFKELPTIEILTMNPKDYADPLEFHIFNSKSTDIEIAPLGHMDHLFKRDDILRRLNSSIEQTESNLKTLKLKRAVFIEKFGKFFENNKK